MLRMLFGGNSGNGNNSGKQEAKPVTRRDLAEMRVMEAMKRTGGREQSHRYYHARVRNKFKEGTNQSYYFDSILIMNLWMEKYLSTLGEGCSVVFWGVSESDTKMYATAERLCIKASDFLAMSDDEIRHEFYANRII